jgi:hypothetical protein
MRSSPPSTAEERSNIWTAGCAERDADIHVVVDGVMLPGVDVAHFALVGQAYFTSAGIMVLGLSEINVRTATPGGSLTTGAALVGGLVGGLSAAFAQSSQAKRETDQSAARYKRAKLGLEQVVGVRARFMAAPGEVYHISPREIIAFDKPNAIQTQFGVLHLPAGLASDDQAKLQTWWKQIYHEGPVECNWTRAKAALYLRDHADISSLGLLEYLCRQGSSEETARPLWHTISNAVDGTRFWEVLHAISCAATQDGRKAVPIAARFQRSRVVGQLVAGAVCGVLGAAIIWFVVWVASDSRGGVGGQERLLIALGIFIGVLFVIAGFAQVFGGVRDRIKSHAYLKREGE